VLHQLEREALEFLTGEQRLEPQRLGGPVGPVTMASGRDPHDEILLNWPDAVTLVGERTVRAAIAHVGVVPTAGSRWRTVLEVDDGRRRLPVLVRTPTGREPPLAVCSALLSPRVEAHAALLANLVLWCAAGRPTAVVVDVPPASNAAVVQRTLRLQGRARWSSQ
jgi:hypothetical protein